MHPYVMASQGSEAFNCPLCDVYATQDWYDDVRFSLDFKDEDFTRYYIKGLTVCECGHCHSQTLWMDDKLIFPRQSTAPHPAADMPEDVLRDYEEARAVFDVSPRASAALLRLALQRLFVHIGQPGKEINTDIKTLVKAGLPKELQQALDIIRVTGNEAVHPGTIDFDENPSFALPLFDILNLVVTEIITRRNTIGKIYNALPPDKIKAIDDRDKNSTGGKP